MSEQVSILLVDDQPENLLALTSVLEPLGQRLVCAASGEEALRAVLREDFALILLDVRMPGIDGLETARHIASRERSRRTPIIFLTAQDADLEEVFRGYEAGGVDYVVKPFEPTVLRSKVSVFVELHRERAERVREAGARAEAEAVAATVGKLQAVSDVALAHLEIDELMPTLLRSVAALVSAETSGVLLAENEAGTTLQLCATHGTEPSRPNGVVSGTGGFLARVLSGRRPVILPDASLETSLDPSLLAGGVRSLLATPLVSRDRLLGVIYAGAVRREYFSSEDALLFGLSAERASMAIDHARSYERERNLVAVLQRSLLPELLPELRQLQMAARYLPSESAAQVGGDWYDAIGISDNLVALAIGDVVGHGVRAATVMGELRNSLRAYVLEGHPAATAIQRLSALVRSTHGDAMVSTLALMTVDTQAGEASLVNAGHPPPLLLTPSGETRFLESCRMPALSVSSTVQFQPSAVHLDPGSTLIFFTDGLVERRDQSIDAGLETLRQAVLTGPTELDALCEHILATLLGGRPPGDDVALLVARLTEPRHDREKLRLAARAESVATARRALARMLCQLGAAPEDIFDLTLVLSEACSNAVEHAYGPGDHEFVVDLEIAQGMVTVVVCDKGRWRDARGQDQGRGLKLIDQLTDDLEIERDEEGTTVRFRKRLRGGPAPPAGEEAGA